MSRLEEIKMKVNNTTTEPLLYVPYADMQYLINRVEELEQKLRVDSELFEKQVKINNRYKQALKEIKERLYGNEIVYKIAQNALNQSK